MTFLNGKCPACAKSIQIPKEEETFFCTYCGSKFLKDAALAFCGLPAVSAGDKDLSGFVIVGSTLTAYKGSATNIIVPETVSCIAKSAFKGNKLIQSVSMPGEVTSIEYGAFSNCSSLKKVELSDTLTSIGIHAFQGCSSLVEIKLPRSAMWIGNFAFDGCGSMRTAYIPSTCDVSTFAFTDCPAKRVSI